MQLKMMVLPGKTFFPDQNEVSFLSITRKLRFTSPNKLRANKQLASQEIIKTKKKAYEIELCLRFQRNIDIKKNAHGKLNKQLLEN